MLGSVTVVLETTCETYADGLDERWQAVAGCLDVAFQPVVNIHTGACYGYEALLRGADRAGFGSVEALFDAAHADDILTEVELFICGKAVSRFVTLPHFRRSKLFLNLDGRSLDHSAEIAARISCLLDDYDLDESSAVIEISERRALTDAMPLAAFKRANYHLAIDDFGTGFAGLQMLYFAEPDFLKIDRFFVADIADDSKKKLFLGQIVHTAHLLGAIVLAEGVETELEYHVCKDIGCDLVQGFLIQRPTLDLEALLPRYGAVEELARRDRRTLTGDQKLIGAQVAELQPIQLGTPMNQVFDRFRADKAGSFFPVVDDAHEPLGIVREKELKAYAYSPFGKELISNKALGRKLKDFVIRCPIADINSRAEQVLQAYSTMEDSEGILIVEDMKYVGFLSAHSLLRVINEKNLAAARDQNPLTKLPGNNLIHEWVSNALGETTQEVTLAYFDFDNFKPFNDKYGFRLGDRAILLFAELLAKALPRETCFAGHIGGDDFFAGFRAICFEDAMEMCRSLVETFRRDVESFYDDETRTIGVILGQDRMGNPARFPLMTVSAAVVQLPRERRMHSVDEVSSLIAKLKKEAKSSPARICAGTLV